MAKTSGTGHSLDAKITTRIWVDADACPKDIKDILFRAAEPRCIQLILVANNPLNTPRANWKTSIAPPSPQSSPIEGEEVLRYVVSGL